MDAVTSNTKLRTMPYKWTSPPETPQRQLRLWPHQSLPPAGFVLFIGITAILLTLPLLPLLGTVLLWGLLPFLGVALFGVWFAIHRNRQNAQIIEILDISDTETHLTRHGPHGQRAEWMCNRHWCQVSKYDKDGPVPHYITLRGSGREVEIGAFLSEDERCALYDDLCREIRP